MKTWNTKGKHKFLHFYYTIVETHPKGRAHMQVYRVVPITKKGNYTIKAANIKNIYIIIMTEKGSIVGCDSNVEVKSSNL